MVRLVYDLYLDGESVVAIIRTLKHLQVETPRGKDTWSKRAIETMLKNEKYAGDVIVYKIYCDMLDETGEIAILATILASNSITLKNIGIVNNREFDDAVLRIEFYDEESRAKAIEILRKHRYTVYE